jgi:hypothetical protein
MVVELKANCAGATGFGFDKRNAALIIHDVQREAVDVSGAAVLAIHLDRAQIKALLRFRASRRLSSFAYAVSGGVIDVVGALALMNHSICIAGIDRLTARHLQLILEIPSHYL